MRIKTKPEALYSEELELRIVDTAAAGVQTYWGKYSANKVKLQEGNRAIPINALDIWHRTELAINKGGYVRPTLLPDGSQLRDTVNYMLTMFSETGTQLADYIPDGPASIIVNDVADTFDWELVQGYPDLTSYEYTIDGGTTWQAVTVKPIAVGDVAIAAGQVGVRSVDGAVSSLPVFNTTAFTVYVAPVEEPVVEGGV